MWFLSSPLHQGAAVAACCIWGITCRFRKPSLTWDSWNTPLDHLRLNNSKPRILWPGWEPKHGDDGSASRWTLPDGLVTLETDSFTWLDNVHLRNEYTNIIIILYSVTRLYSYSLQILQTGGCHRLKSAWCLAKHSQITKPFLFVKSLPHQHNLSLKLADAHPHTMGNSLGLIFNLVSNRTWSIRLSST